MKDKELIIEKHECYSPGYNTELVQSYQRRTVVKEAGFFIPHLSSEISLLDCGCGPGTITVGLARVIAPGHVTGVDIESSQIEIARNYAKEQGVSNVQFEVSSIYKLPFKDNSFDAVFVHALLQHLQNPLKALEELKRVLKPGGVIGLRDDDQGGLILSPYSPEMERVIQLLKQFIRHNGGDPCVGRRHRELLRKAGFTKIEASATCECDGTQQDTKKRGILAVKLIEHMSEAAIKFGWAGADELEQLKNAAKEWGENQDAFDAIIWCEAVGYKISC